MSLLSFSDIAANRVHFRDIHVDKWKGDVRIGRLAVRDRLGLMVLLEHTERDETGKIIDDADAVEFSVWLISKSITDADGELAFDSDEGRDFLRAEDIDVLNQLANEAIEINGFASNGELEEAKKK